MANCGAPRSWLSRCYGFVTTARCKLGLVLPMRRGPVGPKPGASTAERCPATAAGAARRNTLVAHASFTPTVFKPRRFQNPGGPTNCTW